MCELVCTGHLADPSRGDECPSDRQNSLKKVWRGRRFCPSHKLIHEESRPRPPSWCCSKRLESSFRGHGRRPWMWKLQSSQSQGVWRVAQLHVGGLDGKLMAIWCDGLRPVCARCTRLGLTCEGYRNAGALIFRDQTEVATRSFDSIGVAEIVHVPTPKSLHALPRYVDTTGHAPWLGPSITCGVHPKWEDIAVARFLTSYVLERSPQNVHMGYSCGPS